MKTLLIFNTIWLVIVALDGFIKSGEIAELKSKCHSTVLYYDADNEYAKLLAERLRKFD